LFPGWSDEALTVTRDEAAEYLPGCQEEAGSATGDQAVHLDRIDRRQGKRWREEKGRGILGGWTRPPAEPGMIGPSPSERGLPTVPADPAEHAADFSRQWRDRIEPEAGRIMREVGIPPERIGSRDIEHGVRRNFFPRERDGGGISPGGGINLDSGIFNPRPMAHLGPEARGAWEHASVKVRAKAAIAHEDMEWRTDSHEMAVELAPETDLNIGAHARKLLRAIRIGEQRRR
jgi:hypothetical protein